MALPVLNFSSIYRRSVLQAADQHGVCDNMLYIYMLAVTGKLCVTKFPLLASVSREFLFATASV